MRDPPLLQVTNDRMLTLLYNTLTNSSNLAGRPAAKYFNPLNTVISGVKDQGAETPPGRRYVAFLSSVPPQ